MTAIDGRHDDDDYDDQDDDWYDDDDDYREPDPEDAEIARSYAEMAEHEEMAHGGHQCDCPPSLLERLSWRMRDARRWLADLRYRVRNAARQPWTVCLPGAEVTVRLRPSRDCGACGGQGWAYGLDPGKPDLRPPGYNTVSLCGCGTAIGKLADSRRAVRRMRNDPPF